MKIETDLDVIKRLAEKRFEANCEFRSFLKGLDIEIEDLDSIVHKIYFEISKQIDCTRCANCCKHVTPTLDDDDISRFSKSLSMNKNEFTAKFLTRDEDIDDGLTFCSLPCPFLKNNLCSNYDNRPKDCESYPHLHKDDFVFRLWGVIDNYGTCPIVFNVYEKLKSELLEFNNLYENDYSLFY